MANKFQGFGGMNNMQNMMKQAQALQEKVAAAQKELDEAVLTADSGGGLVTVTMNGRKEILSVKIDKKAVDPDDVEMLEDLIIAAINEAKNRADALHKEKMEPLTGGLGLF